jgi:DNA-binding transcriptional LysR family regulator
MVIAYCYLHMEWRQLRYFAAVAGELSFRKAAALLHVAQPALSRQVRLLEEDLGVRLLERSSHHVALTPAGEVFLDRCRALLREWPETVAATRRAARGETGRLSIAFIGSIGHHLLPRLLQTYRRTFPSVDLALHELRPDEQIADILGGRLDLGFVGMAFDHPDLHVETLAEDRLVAALPADHPLARRKTLPLGALAQERFVLTSPRHAPYFNAWLAGLCRVEGFVPLVVREADRATTVLNYLAAGQGVSIFPAPVARYPVPGVVFVPLDRKVPPYRYAMAWNKKEPVGGPLGRFVEMARALARKRPIGA